MDKRVVLITGASRGIGAEIAREFAGKNYNVVINYFGDLDNAKGVQAECEKLGAKVEIFDADVSKFDKCKELVDFAVEKFGRLDVLVNNAGITKDGLVMRMTEEQFDAVINVNLKSAFNMIRNAVPIMVKARYGRIISISSVVGISGNAGQANYAASKAGVIGMTKSISKEIGSRGITVNAVAPGSIETPMTDALPDKVKEFMINATSLKRFGKPKDIANAVSFLASEESSYITGQVLVVDGGLAL